MTFLNDPEAAKAFFTVVAAVIGGAVTITGTIMTVRQARKANAKTNTINENNNAQTNAISFSNTLLQRITKLEDRVEKAETEIDTLKHRLLEKEQELLTTQRQLTSALTFIRTLLAFIANLTDRPTAPPTPPDLLEELT